MGIRWMGATGLAMALLIAEVGCGDGGGRRGADAGPDPSLDSDGDGIPDALELGPDGLPLDFDRDTIPDHLDADSDGDGIPDAVEGDLDCDGDGFPNRTDLDSDGDGIPDADEVAEDGTPTHCEAEVVADAKLTPAMPPFASDGIPDYLDPDSDNDGLTDGEELLFGTDVCGWDSDGDGYSDLRESVAERVRCPDGPDAPGARFCGCARDPACIVDDGPVVVLPFNGPVRTREVTFTVVSPPADVMLLVQNSEASVAGLGDTPLSTVREAVLPIAEAVAELSADGRVGLATVSDFPLGGYGSGDATCDDVPLRILSRLVPASDIAPLASAVANLRAACDRDDGAAHTEALLQLLRFERRTWSDGTRSYTPSEEDVPPCAEDTTTPEHGAACFRDDARKVLVHFATGCAHAGPGSDTFLCPGYRDLTPAPATWNALSVEMFRQDPHYVGVNLQATDLPSAACGMAPSPDRGPCFYLSRTAELARDLSPDRRKLLIDHPPAEDADALAAEIVDALRSALTPQRVGLFPGDAGLDFVDPREFASMGPSCRYVPADGDALPRDPCWVPPAGVRPEDAVILVDRGAFVGPAPGTTVTFELSLQNSHVPADHVSRAFVLPLELADEDGRVLARREAIIIVPGDPMRGGACE